MTDLLDGLIEAVRLILSLNPTVYEIIALSLYVSLIALLLSAILGIPLGVIIGLNEFPARSLVIAVLYTGMGLPPVVVGLFVYLLLSRSGPVGGLGWLFTPQAMIIAQTIIALPLVAGLTMSAIISIDPNLRLQLRSLGATDWQTTLATLLEARDGVIVSMVAGFGSIISEVGAVMLVGGNIEGHTRTLTTAIVLETRKGDFDLAMALGIVLLGLSFVSNLLMLHLQGFRR